MPKEPIRIVEHTADWSLLVTGQDLEQLFKHAALGMVTLMVGDPGAVSRDVVRQIVLEAYDAESLLVDWLSELAYWAESEQLVCNEIEIVEMSETRLAARVCCGQASALDKHIKAVTYHNLAIREGDSGLEATIVFDV